MAMVGNATVAVGDALRCKDDDWEGSVLSIDDTAGTVTLRMNVGPQRTVPLSGVHYNSWDPKAAL